MVGMNFREVGENSDYKTTKNTFWFFHTGFRLSVFASKDTTNNTHLSEQKNQKNLDICHSAQTTRELAAMDSRHNFFKNLILAIPSVPRLSRSPPFPTTISRCHFSKI